MIILTGINMYLYLFVMVSWTLSFLLTVRGTRGVSKVGNDSHSEKARYT